MAVYQTSGTITTAGITAAIEAGVSGPQIDVAGFRLGSNSAVQGDVAQVTDTDVSGFVYASDTTNMTYSQVDQDTVVWTIRLDTTVGNFEVGNVGLVLTDGTLFCRAVLPGQFDKYQNSLPGTVGNVRYINILMRLANVASLINLSLVTANNASLPEVANETDLPNASTTVYDAYLVDNHTHVGVSTTSVRLNGAWWHATHRSNPGQGQGVIVSNSAAFASSAQTDGSAAAPTLGPVGYDTSVGLFVAADDSSGVATPVGIRTSTFEVTVLGTIPASVAGLSGSLTVGTVYYAGTGVTAGTLVTTGGTPIAVATSTTDIYVDTTGDFLNSASNSANDNEVLLDLFATVVTGVMYRLHDERRIRASEERVFQMNQRLVHAGL